MFKVALLLYGQPRFFNYTYKHIVEEYTIKGCDTDIYAHFWEDIGFGPEDDKNNTYYKIDNLEEILSNIKPKAYIIENYNLLDQKINLIKEKIKKNITRYKLGQLVSMEQCFDLIERSNISYDIIIKVRTDIIYEDKNFYNNKTEYENTKYNCYIKPFETFEKKTNNCLVPQYELYKIPEQLLDNSKYNELINTQSNIDSQILQLLNKIDPEYMYNFKHTYIGIGSDIYNITDYNTARIIYKDWVEKYIKLYEKNSHIEIYKHFYKRLHTMYNFFLTENKVNIHGILQKDRSWRLVYKKSCKEKFLQPNNKKKRVVVINDFNQLNDEYIYSKIKK